MLPSRYRLPRHITRLSGKSISSANLILITQSNQLTHPRFRIIVSKKTIPLAVTRHLINRRLHHILAASLPSLPPRDLVIIIKSPSLLLNFHQLEADLRHLLGSIISPNFQSTV
jgi:ribonuclease P protein component